VKIDREKVVAGISCGEVLDRLSAYIDGELSVDECARIEAHLRGCEVCERFGGEFQATVRALREHLLRPARLPDSVRERVRAALHDEGTRK
jgi:anti-sigma factor (TIGR02949 family)